MAGDEKETIKIGDLEIETVGLEESLNDLDRVIQFAALPPVDTKDTIIIGLCLKMKKLQNQLKEVK